MINADTYCSVINYEIFFRHRLLCNPSILYLLTIELNKPFFTVQKYLTSGVKFIFLRYLLPVQNKYSNSKLKK